MTDPKILDTRNEDYVGKVSTREDQAQLTPALVLDSLRRGNDRFVEGGMTLRNHTVQVRHAAGGQFPHAIVLSCVDSRVPVEQIFDCGIGDVFVARVAGNFTNTDILGSMEFACKVAGAKLVVVMGHGSCGAVQGAIDRVELGHITGMVQNIAPAVDACADYEGDKTSGNVEFVNLVAAENVRRTVAGILEESAVLREMHAAGEVGLVGAMYEMETGRVRFFED